MKNIKKLLFLCAFALFGHTALQAVDNAGVLVYTVKNGELLFLLGKDRRYSDFGGKVDPGENEIEAAAREFNEESVFFFARKFDSRNTLSYKNLYDQKNKQKRKNTQKQAHRLIENKLRTCPYIERADYRMYFLKVDYVSSWELKKQYNTLCRRFGRHWITRNNHAECDDFRWVRYEDIPLHKTRINDNEVQSYDSQKVDLPLRHCFFHSLRKANWRQNGQPSVIDQLLRQGQQVRMTPPLRMPAPAPTKDRSTLVIALDLETAIGDKFRRSQRKIAEIPAFSDITALSTKNVTLPHITLFRTIDPKRETDTKKAIAEGIKNFLRGGSGHPHSIYIDIKNNARPYGRRVRYVGNNATVNFHPTRSKTFKDLMKCIERSLKKAGISYNKSNFDICHISNVEIHGCDISGLLYQIFFPAFINYQKSVKLQGGKDAAITLYKSTRPNGGRDPHVFEEKAKYVF